MRLIEGLTTRIVDGRLAYDTTRIPVDYRDGEVDLRRVVIEVDRAGIVVRESLRFHIDGDRDVVAVIDDDLGELLAIPGYRILTFDAERLMPFYARSLESGRWPDDLRAQVSAAVDDGQISFYNEPDENVVECHANLDDVKVLVATIHRGILVPGWPTTDDGRFLD